MKITKRLLRKIIREEKEKVDELSKTEDAMEEADDLEEDDHWGGDEDEYKRSGGHRTGDVGGHYKDYEGSYGGGKGEYKRSGGHRTGDVGGHYKDYEGPTGGNKGDISKTHPGREDYMDESRRRKKIRVTKRQLQRMVMEALKLRRR